MDIAPAPRPLLAQRRVCHDRADLPRDRRPGGDVFVDHRRLRVLAERHVLRGAILESSFGWRVSEGGVIVCRPEESGSGTVDGRERRGVEAERETTWGGERNRRATCSEVRFVVYVERSGQEAGTGGGRCL